MKSNRYENKHLIGKQVTLNDGRTGVVTHAGYGLISIDLTIGHWICGTFRSLFCANNEASTERNTK